MDDLQTILIKEYDVDPQICSIAALLRIAAETGDLDWPQFLALVRKTATRRIVALAFALASDLLVEDTEKVLVLPAEAREMMEADSPALQALQRQIWSQLFEKRQPRGLGHMIAGSFF